MTTAAWPIDVAVAAAIEADAAIMALLAGGVHSIVAPEGTRLDYVTLGSTSEGDFDAFGAEGNDGVLTVHVWTAVMGKGPALAIYGHLQRVLNNVPLVLDGQRHLDGTLSLLDVRPDVDNRSMHLIARYRYLTRSSA